MKLTEDDYEYIAYQLDPDCSEVDLEKDGLVVVITYDYHSYGYVEDDYYNGTGFYVETGHDLEILDVDCTDEYGRQIPCEVDKDRIEYYL